MSGMSPERSIKTNAVFIILNDVIYSKGTVANSRW